MPEETFALTCDTKKEFVCTCGLHAKLCMAGPLPVLMHEHPMCEEFRAKQKEYVKWLKDGAVEA